MNEVKEMAKTGTFGSFGGGSIDVWTTGTWTSQLLDVSLINKRDTTQNIWTQLTWRELNTDDETKAKVRVDILDSSGNVLQEDLAGTTYLTLGRGFKRIVLSNYTNVKSVNIYVKFKLHSLSENPNSNFVSARIIPALSIKSLANS